SIAPTLNSHFGDKQGLEDQHALGGGGYSYPVTANPLTARMHKGANTTCDEGQTLIPTTGATFDVAHSLRGEGFDASEDGTGRGTPLVPVPFDTTQLTSRENGSNPQPGDPCHPLAASGHPPAIAFDRKASGRNGFGVGDVAPTLRAMGHAGSHSNAGGQIAVAFQERGRAHGRELDIGGDCAYALTAPDAGGRAQERNVLTPDMDVRRITPREAERLQGFPDDYTRIPWREYKRLQRRAAKHGTSFEAELRKRGKIIREPAGTECPDGPRYKALGNSWAVHCVRWIGKKIDEALEYQESPA
ncbi:MAG TPA: DNA cytosine methyltransferase, partial [Gammaproteobacteria bacterium]|nr:DNA cytosine methyltransferase [Gammaproteobacteria bacterium]